MKIILIRHGMTKGNTEKRYIGSTDEPLCTQGIKQILTYIKANKYPEAEVIYTSSLLRCLQTSELIYPDKRPVLCENLRECDFGELENKNYPDLTGNEKYQEWIASNGTLEFPSGENQQSFRNRCIKAYETIIDNSKNDSITLVVHGGTIMSILEKYGLPKKGFYDWQLSNGDGYMCELEEDNRSLKVLRKLCDTGGQL
ncbi:MAG: histidine phosphatase family protein [Anaerocolumna sp.]